MTARFVVIDGDTSDDPTGDFARGGLGAVADTEEGMTYPFGRIASDAVDHFLSEPERAVAFYTGRPTTDVEKAQIAALEESD